MKCGRHRSHAEQSKQLAGKYSYTWVINSLDGYPSDATYSNSVVQKNAKSCNPYLQQLLASGNYNGPVGFVFMDYCCDGDGSGYYGLSLTKELINHNFRYTMSKQGDPIYDGSGNLYVAPKGCDMMWEAKVHRMDGTSLSGPTGWFSTDFDDSNWDTRRFPTANSGAGASYYSLWNETSNTLFLRREFYVDHDPTIDTYKLYVCHDDGFVAYLNGSQFQSESGWIGSYKEFSIPSSILKVGRNVLAIRQEQGDGGAYFDCGVLRIEGTHAPLKLTSNKWHTFVAPGHNVDFSTTNVKAYKIVEIVSGNTPYARAEEVSVVPADEAVVVRSDNGAGTYQIPVTQASSTLSGNLLHASLSPFTVVQENSIYCVADKNGKSGFYPVDVGITVTKGKGYLDLSSSNVKVTCIFLDFDATGIVSPFEETEDGAAIYNLAGQRLSKTHHGINIIGGKKIVY